MKKPAYAARTTNPKGVTTREVLVDLARGGEAFSSRDLEDRYDMTQGNAWRRIQYLLLWGCVRSQGKRKGAHRRSRRYYEVTAHGKRCAKRWGK